MMWEKRHSGSACLRAARRLLMKLTPGSYSFFASYAPFSDFLTFEPAPEYNHNKLIVSNMYFCFHICYSWKKILHNKRA